jgi:hypothetical protein
MHYLPLCTAGSWIYNMGWAELVQDTDEFMYKLQQFEGYVEQMW